MAVEHQPTPFDASVENEDNILRFAPALLFFSLSINIRQRGTVYNPTMRAILTDIDQYGNKRLG